MNLLSRGIEPLGSIHYKIGAPALFFVGHLLGEESPVLLLGHAGPHECPGTLHVGRCRDHHYGIDAAFASGLEQERNIEDDDARP